MKVLFAVNLAEPGYVVRKVEELCGKYDAELYVLHVGAPTQADLAAPDSEGLDAGLYPFGSSDADATDGFGVKRKAVLNAFVKQHFSRPTTAIMLKSSDPAATIINEIERLGADMLVLGQKQQAFLEQLMVGSVSAKVLKLVRVPTLLIPIEE